MVIIYSTSCWQKVWWSFVVHKTFLGEKTTTKKSTKWLHFLPRDPKTDLICTLFKADIFTVATKLKAPFWFEVLELQFTYALQFFCSPAMHFGNPFVKSVHHTYGLLGGGDSTEELRSRRSVISHSCSLSGSRNGSLWKVTDLSRDEERTWNSTSNHSLQDIILTGKLTDGRKSGSEWSKNQRCRGLSPPYMGCTPHQVSYQGVLNLNHLIIHWCN